MTGALMALRRQIAGRGAVTATSGDRAMVGSPSFGVAALVVLAAGLMAGLGGDRYQQTLVGLFGAYAVASLGYTLLVGYGGQLAFGQAAFMAIGAYGYAVTQAVGVPIPVSVAVAVAAAMAAALIVGTAVLRTSDFYLALVTLGFSEATLKLITIWRPSGGENGIGVDLLGNQVWYVAIAAVVVAMLLVERVTRGRFGRALAMVRSDEQAAAAMGVRVALTRVVVFSLSGALAGLGGTLLAGDLGYITPANFDTQLTLLLLVMIVVGGLASIWGALIGTLVIVVVDEALTLAVGYQDIVYGVVLFAVLVLMPRGLVRLPVLAARFLNRRCDALMSPSVTPSELATKDRAAPTAPLGPGPGADTPSLLSLRSVNVRFDAVSALRDVTVDFRQGEITAIVGPNGAGKTTLLNAISGLVKPVSGEIVLDGRLRLDQQPASARARLGLARTFQHSRLFAGLRVLDQLLCGAYSRTQYGFASGLTRSWRVVAEERRLERDAAALLSRTGLGGRELAYLEALSGGHRRLVDLCRGLMSTPRLVLLDEIAAGMTDEEKLDVVRLLREQHQAHGLTIVLIEHDLEFVRSLATTTIVLDRGALLATGPTEEVLARADVLAAYVGGV